MGVQVRRNLLLIISRVSVDQPFSLSATVSARITSTVWPQVFSALTFVNADHVIAAEPSANGTTLMASSNAGKRWSVLSTIPADVTRLDFPATNAGFALSGPVNGGPEATLWRSVTGGRHWSPIFHGDIVGLQFLSSTKGYIMVRRQQAVFLETTATGGKTWDLLPSPFKPGVWSAALSFISSDQGWILAGSEPGAGSQWKWLYETSDGGQHWALVASTSSQESPELLPFQLPLGGYVDSLQFVTSQKGWMALSRGGLWMTRDGGRQWLSADETVFGPGLGRDILAMRFWNRGAAIATANGGKSGRNKTKARGRCGIPLFKLPP